tara:strand:+ start:608 stop:1354 length:747 start_codon:yes stop_codon:yes gene_type:complete
MRRSLVAGNWKMNGSRKSALELATAIGAVVFEKTDVVVAPPTLHLDAVSSALSSADVLLAGQDCSEHEKGAYTGENSALMLREIGCSHVIVGHSERRQLFGETDQRVALKVGRAVAVGLIPIICVGETLLERRDSMTDKVIERQVLTALSQINDKTRLKVVIAYEPVWAIGTGESASPEQAQKVHLLIRGFLSKYDMPLSESTRILYGGSVKPDNAASLFAMPDIDGGLIGGASLDAKSFINICRSTS